MKYEEISKPMRLFMGAREGFRKLGFSPDDLYCMTAGHGLHNGELWAFCLLRTQDKEFSIECGPIESETALGEEYKHVAEAMANNQIPQEDLDRIWAESAPRQNSVGFIEALLFKGFKIPRQHS